MATPPIPLWPPLLSLESVSPCNLGGVNCTHYPSKSYPEAIATRGSCTRDISIFCIVNLVISSLHFLIARRTSILRDGGLWHLPPWVVLNCCFFGSAHFVNCFDTFRCLLWVFSFSRLLVWFSSKIFFYYSFVLFLFVVAFCISVFLRGCPGFCPPHVTHGLPGWGGGGGGALISLCLRDTHA